MTEDREPVRCLNCDQPVQRLTMVPSMHPDVDDMKNEPCGCRNAGVLFDFKPGRAQ